MFQCAGTSPAVTFPLIFEARCAKLFFCDVLLAVLFLVLLKHKEVNLSAG